ncbi:MAG: FIST N-terminal domain-containing protein, partial [Campylobacterota bacterium]|nr:FIST N-terminal domain-containing protein [Campylobacterota bacterium]
MKIDTLSYDNENWNLLSSGIDETLNAQIVFVFGDTDVIKLERVFHSIKEKYPNAHIVGASSAGNILGPEISSSAIVASAVEFESSSVVSNVVDFGEEVDVEALSK